MPFPFEVAWVAGAPLLHISRWQLTADSVLNINTITQCLSLNLSIDWEQGLAWLHFYLWVVCSALTLSWHPVKDLLSVCVCVCVPVNAKDANLSGFSIACKV